MTSDRVLDIKDFNEVYQESKQFSTQWIVIGLGLGISKTTIDGIRAHRDLDDDGCMSKIISAWLKKDTPEQPLPTWRILCDAIAKVDSTAAEKIATDKGFDCMPTTVLQDEIYTGIMFYVKEATNRWKMWFMVVNSNKIMHLLKYLNENYSDAERDDMFKFSFMDSMNGFIALDLQSTFKNGWRIEPHMLPMMIRKRDVDLFGTVDRHIPPSCLATMWCEESQNADEYLSYHVPLIGIHSDIKEIRIQRFLETSNRSVESTSKPAVLDEKNTLSKKHEDFSIDASLTTSIKVKNKDIPFLCHKLRGLNADWEAYGIALHVPYDTIQEIKQSYHRPTAKEKMTEVLWLWRYSKGKKTWGVVHNAVKQLKNMALAEIIERKGLNNEVPLGDSYIEDMLTLLQDIIPDWEQFGLELGIPYSELSQIEENLKSEGHIRKVIEKWIERCGSEATIYKIIVACCRIKHFALAERLKEDKTVRERFGMDDDFSTDASHTTSIKEQSRVTYVLVEDNPLTDTSELQSTSDTDNDKETVSDVHVVDETILTLTKDEECTLDWPEYGLQIDFPKGSLPSGHTAMKLPVKAIVAGDFILPPDCHLVSGIYWIKCPEWFSKKVTLHLPHAAIIESEKEASYFRFFAAKCSSGPPYEFKELVGGSFTPFSKSASIKLHQFSYFSVGGIARAISDWLWGIRQRYYSHVFYKLKQPHEWDMHFVVTKDDPAFQQFIKKKYSDCLDGAHQIIKLEENASCIRLQADSDSLDQWKINIIIAPEINKEEIEYFTPQRTHVVPHCHFNFCWNSELPLKILNMKIVLQGVTEPNNFFRVILPQTAPPGPTNPTFRDLLMKPPEMNDAVHFMTEIAASWDEIGIALDVPPDYRDSLLRDPRLDNVGKMDRVIRKWGSTQSTDVTWEKILKALKTCGQSNIAATMTEFLEKPENYAKYINKADFVHTIYF